MAKKKKVKAEGRLSIAEMRKLVNKKAGIDVAYDLTKKNPTDVYDWISTGSRWLDSIICRGKLAGIPMGKVVELAGLEATGKSYMAAQIAKNAQERGVDVVYFDAESAIDTEFLKNTGCDIENLLYVQAASVEFVLETIEDLLANSGSPMLFVWDSIAMTPAVSDVEGDFNPNSSVGVKARVFAKGMTKIIQLLANTRSTLLCLNQLKTFIPKDNAQRIQAMIEPYTTPGGKALNYSYSLRIWLTNRKSKASYLTNEAGFRIGSEVKAKIKKSRFGTDGRTCAFKILWGTDDVAVRDEESWFEAIKNSERLKLAGSWYTLMFRDGKEKRFQSKQWLTLLKDKDFKKEVMNVMDEEVIQKFDDKTGNAELFYDVDKEESGAESVRDDE